MPNARDLNPFSTATEMLAALRAKRIGAAELLEMHIERVERIDRTINSVVVKDYDRARRDAAEADHRLARGDEGALLGLPITVKESIDVENLPSTAGVEARAGHRATSDAITVRRLRAAGAVIFGKTNVCPWLADYQGDNPLYGRTLNPWNPERTSGGSTAGSAALAAGCSALELGSDLGGSIRVPAAFCGLWGHKPSETLVPNSGHFPGSHLPNAGWIMAVQGPHGRSASDLRLALDVMAGPDVGMDAGWRVALPPPRHERLREYRVGVMPSLPWVTVEPEIVAALASFAERLRGAGVSVTELQPQVIGDLREHYRTYRRMMWALVSTRWPDAHRQHVIEEKLKHEDEFQRDDVAGIRATAADFVHWHAQREEYRDAYRVRFHRYDVILTPVTIVNAFPHTRLPNIERRFDIAGRRVDFEYMNFYPGLATLSGQPATALPAGMSSDGLPIGLQAIGPFLEDHTPLRFAELVEREFGGFKVPPSLAEV